MGIHTASAYEVFSPAEIYFPGIRRDLECRSGMRLFNLAGWSESESKSEQKRFFCPSPAVIRLEGLGIIRMNYYILFSGLSVNTHCVIHT